MHAQRLHLPLPRLDRYGEFNPQLLPREAREQQKSSMGRYEWSRRRAGQFAGRRPPHGCNVLDPSRITTNKPL